MAYDIIMSITLATRQFTYTSINHLNYLRLRRERASSLLSSFTRMDQTFLINHLPMKNRHVCDETQIIIDLFTSGIGRDAAIKYYRDSIWKTEKV